MTNTIQNNFDKAAKTYDENAIVQVKAGEYLLNMIRNQLMPATSINHIVDLGAGTGRFSHKLLEFFPNACVCAFDLSHQMLKVSKQNYSGIECLQGDFNTLPFQSHSVDLAFSNFSLQWSHELSHTFSQLSRLLKKNGWLFFSIPGFSTLYELKTAFKKIDAYSHVNTFYTLENISQFLENENLTPIHTHTEFFKRHFKDLFSLLKHLKLSGANTLIKHDAQFKIQKTLMTPSKIDLLTKAYQTFQENNLFPATYETYFIVAQKKD